VYELEKSKFRSRYLLSRRPNTTSQRMEMDALLLDHAMDLMYEVVLAERRRWRARRGRGGSLPPLCEEEEARCRP
ncbi:unnamed protein product, partial [Urochloa humidicola]